MVFLLWICVPVMLFAKQTTVSNTHPRLDSTQQILDIHDGNIVRVGDVFYWYGAGYGGCSECKGDSGCCDTKVGACGFNLNHTVNLATSTDLVHWENKGTVLTAAEHGANAVMFSPWVARSPTTGLYVMWYTLLPALASGHVNFLASYYAVATSTSPDGPFKFRKNITGLAYQSLPDAGGILVDDDGKAYIAFTHETTHEQSVQELDPNLLGPLAGGRSSRIGHAGNEGLVFFKRRNRYYLGFGGLSCFGRQGSNVAIWSSEHPLGPYNASGDIMPSAAWSAQSDAVFFVGAPGDDDADLVLYGDRWQSAPDGLKSHDFTYMTPIRFHDNGSVVSVTAFESNVTINY